MCVVRCPLNLTGSLTKERSKVIVLSSFGILFEINEDTSETYFDSGSHPNGLLDCRGVTDAAATAGSANPDHRQRSDAAAGLQSVQVEYPEAGSLRHPLL